MSLAIPTYDELVREAREALRKKAGITNFSESSAANTLVETQAAYVLDLYRFLVDIERESKLSTAHGGFLDHIGDQFGVKRLPAKAATTVGGGAGVMFTNTSELDAITIPERTRLWSSRDQSIAYYTLYEVIVPTVQEGGRAYVDVVAEGTGQSYNVGPESLNRHNVPSSYLSVTNILPIVNGTAVENDENYRYRIANALLAKSGSNETAIKMRLLELPGVRDVVLQPLVRGTGTIDAVIIPVGRRVTQALLDQCQAALSEVVAFGISAKAKAPVERPVDLTVRVTTASGGDSELTKSLVSAAARSYIDNLGIGDGSGSGDIIINELISRMMNVHEDVLDVSIQLRLDNKGAMNINHRAGAGERFYLQAIKVV